MEKIEEFTILMLLIIFSIYQEIPYVLMKYQVEILEL